MNSFRNLIQWFPFMKSFHFLSRFFSFSLDSFNIFSAQLPPYCDDAPVDDGVDVHLDLRMQPNEHPLKHHLYLNVHYALATIYMAKSLASFAYVCNGTRKRKRIVKFNFINLCNRNCIFLLRCSKI